VCRVVRHSRREEVLWRLDEPKEGTERGVRSKAS
jgi:hypothetical protein